MEYLTTDCEFIDEWAGNWCKLVDLIYETIRTDKPLIAPSQPDIIQENRYQSLRSWLMENEARFLSLWERYYHSRDWTLDANKDIIHQIHDADICLKNPFAAFYTVESLDSLLHCISGLSKKYPTVIQAWNTAMDLLRLDSVALSFVTSFIKPDGEE
jgi:hypothetical protein